MAVTPNSFIDYIATSAQTIFPIVRPRLSDAHLRVFQNGRVLVLTTDYTIVGDDVVLVVGASTGDKVRIQRDTPQVTRVVDFMAGANLVESDLDQSALQNLFLAQEVWDQVLQLRDQAVAVIDWTAASLPEHTSDYEENADSRLTPTLGVEAKPQQYIEVDATLKTVTLSPGAYKIDIVLHVANQDVGNSSLSASVADDDDTATATIIHALAIGATIDEEVWVSGCFVVNLTVETVYSFKAAGTSAGASINVVDKTQWTVTRLGGDPALN